MIYSFGEFELDTQLHELRCGGEPRHVEPQVFDLLTYLVTHRDRLVSKQELLEAVWGHRFVAPATLNSRIKAVRQAVGDDGSTQQVIRTIHGRGFRVVAEVEERPTRAGRVATATVPGIEQRIGFCTAPDGTRIAYAMSGAGPPLLKPANWLTHLEHDWESPVWRHWLRELSRDHTLIRYDARGSGLSDWDVENISFDAWVQDLETVVDALGLERFPLFAMSQACGVAIAYAARHPERVTGLVLYGGFVQGALKRARTPRQLEEATMMIRILPLGWGRDNPAFRQFFATIFLPDGTPEQMRWFNELQSVTTSPENAVRLRTTSAEIDVRDLVSSVKAPTLVLHASRDAAVPFEQGRLLAASVPQARFVPLDSPNHILLEDEPAWAQFVDEVRQFLAGLKATESTNQSRTTPPPRSE